MTTYRENIEQVLFDVHWLNVPHSLKIPSSFDNDSTMQRLTEWNIPRRMPHKKGNKSEPTSWWVACNKHCKTERDRAYYC